MHTSKSPKPSTTTPTIGTGNTTGSELSPFANQIRADHQLFYTLREFYFSSELSTNPVRRQAVLLQLLWEISRHILAEHILVHPWYIKAVGEEMGGKLKAFDIADHQTVKAEIVHLLDLHSNPGNLEFDRGVEKIIGSLRRHNDSEEESDIPTLVSKMSPSDNIVLASGLEKSKEFFIPERFHRGDGTTITMPALRAALTVPDEVLRSEFLRYLGLQDSPAYN
ncbi:hypothetical protein AN958_10847 [Leucoagaricus sp. SymC.cos]|nr:hypothetical protein AN958_10847 [Leucoagaricus sp. SymC.cos]